MSRVIVSLVLLFFAGSATAGNNSAGKAWLSWDREGTTSQIGQPPSYQFPLYLHLADAPEIAVLGVDLRWSMGDSSRCYNIVSSSPDIGCGWTTDSLPNGDFEGDSTYTWKISFQGSERSCVIYTVSAATCSTSSTATFWLASVVTKDANGAVDSLEVLEQASIGSMAQAAPPEPEGEAVPGIVLMEFNADAVETDASPMGLRHIRNRALREFLRDRGFAGARKVYWESRAADTLLVARDGYAVRVPDVSRWYVLKLNEGVNVERLLDTLRTLPGVARARQGRTVRKTAVPNDPQFGQQWQLNAPAGVRAVQAWNLGTGRSDVIIGIVDDGVDYGHGDLDPGDRSHVIQGYDTADQDSDPRDDIPAQYGGGHGTAVAGIPGALTDNGNQVAGIMWNCKILPVKVFTSQSPWWCVWPFNCVGQGFDWDIADGIRWAAQHGANVINMSFGGPNNLNPSELLGSGDPIATSTYTAFQLGAVPLAAMGNYGPENNCTTCYPAAFPWVVAVGATNSDSLRASFSVTGPHIDIAAPGASLWTTDRFTGTGYFSGTSAATPTAAGVAGLVLAEGRDWGVNLTNEDVAEILMRTARDLAPPGHDWDTGHGLVDAREALTRLNPPYSVRQGSAVGGAVTLSWGPHKHNFTNNGGLPGGQYYGVSQYEVRQHVNFCGPYAELTARTWRSRSLTWQARGSGP